MVSNSITSKKDFVGTFKKENITFCYCFLNQYDLDIFRSFKLSTCSQDFPKLGVIDEPYNDRSFMFRHYVQFCRVLT
jgi:hypothetical protein